MLRKVLFWIVLLGALGVFAIPARAAKSYTAERYESVLSVQADGTLLVTETVVFYFEGGPFTYVFRDLNYPEIDGIDQVQAEMDGQPLPPGAQVGQFEAAAADPLKVTWRFEPVSDSSHEFKLSYRVHGALRQLANSDSLFWYAVPENHEYPIAQALVRLEYPAQTSLLARPALNGASQVTVESDSQSLTWRSGALPADSGLFLSADFTPGSLVNQPPAWQQRALQHQSQRRLTMPISIGVALLFSAIGVLATLSFIGYNRRQGFTPEPAPLESSLPPSELPPALVARLLGSGQPGLAVLFDLARRGLLRIEEGRRVWGSRTYYVVRQISHEALRPHEQGFMKAVFEIGKTAGHSAPLNEVAGRLATNSEVFLQPLEEELLALGWLDAGRQTQLSRIKNLSLLGLLTGMLVFLVGVLFASASFDRYDWALLTGLLAAGAGAGLAFSGILGLITAGLFSPLSNAGLQQANQWRGFAGYLRSVCQGRQAEVQPDGFERYLPYAAAFGLAPSWAAWFGKHHQIVPPDWFMAADSSDAGSFTAVIAAVTASTNSFTSADSGDAGGGGGDGGGSSGAG